MSDLKDNVISASARFANGKEDSRDLDQQHRDGERIMKFNQRVKLSPSEREIIARNIGYYLHNYGIRRQSVANTRACQEHNIDSKELYRLVLSRDEGPAPPNRLRAIFIKYRQVILGIAELQGLDVRLIANRIAYGTRIHPSTGSIHSNVEHIIRMIYDLTEALDLKYGLAERFRLLGHSRNLLPANAPFACWPNGKCYQENTAEEVERTGWWWGIASEFFMGDEIIEGTSLRNFLRYVPHYFIGIHKDYDFDWPIPESSSTITKRPLFGYSLRHHQDKDVIRENNKKRVAEMIGDVSRQQMSWDEGGKGILINGLTEEDFMQRSKDHFHAYLEEVGLDPSRSPVLREDIGERGIWICLYPSWNAKVNQVPNLVPVIVQNYGSGGFCGDITLAVLDVWLQSIAESRLINGMTVGKRLEEALSSEGLSENPEMINELCRTALFIEHHPLLKSYRKLQSGAQKIREFRASTSIKI